MCKEKRKDLVSTNDEGFTLFELLIVICILSLLVTFVAPQALKTLRNARISIAHQEVIELQSYVERFAVDVGRLPRTDEGLLALEKPPADAENWQGPYVKAGTAERDPWNHNWIYRQPSVRPGDREYDLCSPGPSGKGSEPGDEQTICNP